MKNIVAKLKTYFAYFKIKFLNEIQYKIAAIAGIITQFAWGGMYIMLYSAFLSDGSASDYTIPQMCTYIWLGQAFFALFNIWNIDNDILESARTGDISLELVKPVGLYLIWHAKTFGKKIASMLLRAIPIITICSLPFLQNYRLMPPVSIGALVLSIITLIFSAGIMLAFIMLMYTVIMRTISSQGIKTTFYLILNFCSGGLIPIPFMPDTVVNILKFTPFYYMQNVSFNIYNGYINNPTEIVQILVIQVVWFIGLTLFGRYLLNKQLSKIIVQGG